MDWDYSCHLLSLWGVPCLDYYFYYHVIRFCEFLLFLQFQSVVYFIHFWLLCVVLLIPLDAVFYFSTMLLATLLRDLERVLVCLLISSSVLWYRSCLSTCYSWDFCPCTSFIFHLVKFMVTIWLLFEMMTSMWFHLPVGVSPTLYSVLSSLKVDVVYYIVFLWHTNLTPYTLLGWWLFAIYYMPDFNLEMLSPVWQLTLTYLTNSSNFSFSEIVLILYEAMWVVVFLVVVRR